MNPMLENFLDGLDRCNTAEDCQSLFHNTLSNIGLSISAYVYISVPGYMNVPVSTFSDELVQSTTFPNSWRRHYRQKTFHSVDPVYRLCRSSVRPVMWSDVRRIEDLRPDARLVMSDAREFGLSQGLSIPIHGSGGGFALVSAVSQEPESEFDRIVQEFRHTLHLIALYLHAAVESKKREAPSLANFVELTPREDECIKWTAQGKSSWEISTILAISERTVNFHITNSMRKLGVYNKTHAVARAIFLGLTEI